MAEPIQYHEPIRYKKTRTGQAASARIVIQGGGGIRRSLLKQLDMLNQPQFKAGAALALEVFREEVAARAPGSMADKVIVDRVGSLQNFFNWEKEDRRRTQATTVGYVAVNHSGAASLEFGRHWWKRWKQSGWRYHAPGIVARPFVGIVGGDEAIGATAPLVAELFAQVSESMWPSGLSEGEL